MIRDLWGDLWYRIRCFFTGRCPDCGEQYGFHSTGCPRGPDVLDRFDRWD